MVLSWLRQSNGTVCDWRLSLKAHAKLESEEKRFARARVFSLCDVSIVDEALPFLAPILITNLFSGDFKGKQFSSRVCMHSCFLARWHLKRYRKYFATMCAPLIAWRCLRKWADAAHYVHSFHVVMGFWRRGNRLTLRIFLARWCTKARRNDLRQWNLDSSKQHFARATLRIMRRISN